MFNFWLSKTTFLTSLQCKKALYLNKFHAELKDDLTDTDKNKMQHGHMVGKLAQQLFPNGTDVTSEVYNDFGHAVSRTKDLLENDTVVIYEAAFEHNGVLCFVDILEKKKGRIAVYEVKSTTSVKQTHINDTGLQYFVMNACGYKPDEVYVMHVDKTYVNEGNFNANELFIASDITEQVVDFQYDIPSLLKEAEVTLSLDDVPSHDIGLHCTDPIDCPFKGYCWKHVPEYSVFNIAYLKKKVKFELYEDGIMCVTDVPHSYLNKNQIQQVESERNGKVTINKTELTKFVKSLNYPLHFLDFESFQTPIPTIQNSKPFQQIVSQYSMHIQTTLDGELEHFEYLATQEDSDPRKQFVEQLINEVNEKGDVLVYNISFERGRLKELMEVFPQHQRSLQNIIDRMVDLMIPFQKRHFYAPELKGSYSIKAVLPCLVPELSYKDLIINNGVVAMNTFLSLFNGTFSGNVDKTRKALLEYCRMDTFAMVKIVEKLVGFTI